MNNTEVGQDFSVGEAVANVSNGVRTSTGATFEAVAFDSSTRVRISQNRSRPVLSSETINVSSSLNAKSLPALPVVIFKDRSLYSFSTSTCRLLPLTPYFEDIAVAGQTRWIDFPRPMAKNSG